MENKTTEIINWLTQKIANKEPISPSIYLDVAMKLNLLIADEQSLLYEIQQKVAQKKSVLIASGKSVAQSKIMVEAEDEYRDYLTQKAKIEQIIEYIRISKIQARMSSEEFKGY